ncbi:MAG: hypothetical protein KAH22_02755 [Thiotrichaceae bacterium]|nr:hypothetical protein [Thiotrichaceae bacterium]
MLTPFLKTTIALTLLSMATLNAYAACSTQQVDHYLKKGFSHEQIVQLCGTQAQASTGSLSVSRPTASTPSNRVHSNKQTYFNTVIEGRAIHYTGQQLIFERKECVDYGEVNMTGFKEKACVNTRTTVNLANLQVLKANKGLFLVREQQLLVKGTITREYLDIHQLDKYKAATVRKLLSNHPATLNIPVKSGIDPKVVAIKLK